MQQRKSRANILQSFGKKKEETIQGLGFFSLFNFISLFSLNLIPVTFSAELFYFQGDVCNFLTRSPIHRSEKER